MNISSIGNINFGFYPTYKLNTTPKTGDEANEYFLAIDERTRKIPANCWDELYALSQEDKLKAVDFMKATYATVPYYLKDELINPKELSPTINRLLTQNNILDEEEINILKSKLEGTFSPEKLARFLYFKREEQSEFSGNLQFLKELIRKEPKIFDTMAPKTVNKIFLNDIFTYDDFSSSLSTIIEDDLLTPPKNTNWMAIRNAKEYQQMILHESLLGESYFKEKPYKREKLVF